MANYSRRSFLATLLAVLAAWLGLKPRASAEAAVSCTLAPTVAEAGPLVTVYSYDASGRRTRTTYLDRPVTICHHEIARSTLPSRWLARLRDLLRFRRKRKRKEPPQA